MIDRDPGFIMPHLMPLWWESQFLFMLLSTACGLWTLNSKLTDFFHHLSEMPAVLHQIGSVFEQTAAD
jgi:hypothetical protein